MLVTKFITRHFSTTLPQYAGLKKMKTNPGLARHVKLLKKAQPDQEPFANMEHEGDFDYAEHESNFFEVHKTHKELEREMEQRRELVRLKIVQRKYFAQKLPNFLTYGEKEHIRLLHARDANEWSVERLAESFPATEEIIQKILKANWRPYSIKRLKQHDEVVRRNWQTLSEGGHADLPEELRQHLERFSKRDSTATEGQLHEEFVKRPQLPKPKRTEFLELVSVEEVQLNEPPVKEQKQEQTKMQTQAKFEEVIRSTANAVKPQDVEEETYLLQQVHGKRHVTLEELKSKQNKLFKIEGGAATQAQTLQEQTAMVSMQKQDNELALQRQAGDDGAGDVHVQFPTVYETSEVVISAADCRKFEINSAKDRIYIPKKLRQKGATYKVDDSYYDDDGEFLYTVPGMTCVKK